MSCRAAAFNTSFRQPSGRGALQILHWLVRVQISPFSPLPVPAPTPGGLGVVKPSSPHPGGRDRPQEHLSRGGHSTWASGITSGRSRFHCLYPQVHFTRGLQVLGW